MFDNNIITVKNLSVKFRTERGTVNAVRSINFSVRKGEIHGLVGESGCGKTVTAKTFLRLHDNTRTTVGGNLFYSDTDILSLSKKEMGKLRGNEISMIFQDPMTSLNPLLTIGEQINETLRLHKGLDRQSATREAVKLLGQVGIHPEEKRYGQYAHEFSGGMLQRAMIAIALSCGPKLLVADEPTTALDVTIQAQILFLIKQLQKETGMSVLLITHNFGVVAETCDRVSVMYAGEIVESTGVREIFKNPLHPYTKGLMETIPRYGTRGKPLKTIEGMPPDLLEENSGCSFAPRCPRAEECCHTCRPVLKDNGGEHLAACHFVSGLEAASEHIREGVQP
jgi:peptide/nickel transport system ATP-binding protein